MKRWGQLLRVLLTLAVLAAAPACTCGETRLFAGGGISVSEAFSSTGDSRPRLWVSSNAGVSSFLEGDLAWEDHSLGVVEPIGGAAAVWWNVAGQAAERVYVVGDDGRVHEGGYDQGKTFAWFGSSDPNAYAGNLDAVAQLNAGAEPLRHVALVTGWDAEQQLQTIQILGRAGGVFSPDYSGSDPLKPGARVSGPPVTKAHGSSPST